MYDNRSFNFVFMCTTQHGLKSTGISQAGHHLFQFPSFLFIPEYFAHIRIFMAKGRAPLNSLCMSWHGHR